MKALKFDPTLHKKSTTKKDQIEIDREGPRGRVSTHFLGSFFSYQNQCLQAPFGAVFFFQVALVELYSGGKKQKSQR